MSSFWRPSLRRLAGLCGIALHVQQVVDDLEGEAEVLRKCGERRDRVGVGSRRQRTGDGRRAEERAGLAAMNALEQIEGDLLFRREEVRGLPRDQSIVSDRIVEQRGQARGRGGIVAARERAVGEVEQPERREDRDRLSELEVVRRRPRRSVALSMAGRSSRMSDDVCTSSIAAAAASACAAVPPHSSAESSVSTGRTRFDGAKSV